MCGINGFFDFSRETTSTKTIENLKIMNNSIFHRGPDGGGEILLNSSCGIGMKRLSIIDLSLGNQPMTHPDYNVTIVFNGEIYNFKEIKEELLLKNLKFHTNSDTEVLIVAYVAYGISFIHKIKGMFSFCLTDNNTKVTYIFRDRAGEKPLYYSFSDNKFIFSSELKGIISIANKKFKIDKTALNQFLQLRYIPAPLTIFEDVFKLRPGHYLELKDSTIKEVKYFENKTKDDSNKKTKKEYIFELNNLLKKSIENTLQSDVPIGIFLSGGIDSSIVTAIASRKSKLKINTFTVKFKEKQYDESNRAKLIAKKYKTNHTEILMSSEKIFTILDEVLEKLDEPFADPSLLPSYAISKEARKSVKTVITGDGADELFGGYDKYTIFFYTRIFNRLPISIKKIIYLIYSKIGTDNILSRKIQKVLDNSKKDDVNKAVSMMIQGFGPDELNSLLNSDYLVSNPLQFIYDKFDNSSSSNILEKALEVDFSTILEGDMLAKMDRASMYASLETRTPFLDFEIINFAFNLPLSLKVFQNNKKIILKKTFKNLLPSKTLKYSKKGFTIPLSFWIKGSLKQEFIALLNKDFIVNQGIFNYSYMISLFNQHIKGERDNSGKLWTFYIFQKWIEKYQRVIK
jgi:asparagine synthase (glutamine-hydrolysing)